MTHLVWALPVLASLGESGLIIRGACLLDCLIFRPVVRYIGPYSRKTYSSIEEGGV